MNVLDHLKSSTVDEIKNYCKNTCIDAGAAMILDFLVSDMEAQLVQSRITLDPYGRVSILIGHCHRCLLVYSWTKSIPPYPTIQDKALEAGTWKVDVEKEEIVFTFFLKWRHQIRPGSDVARRIPIQTYSLQAKHDRNDKWTLVSGHGPLAL